MRISLFVMLCLLTYYSFSQSAGPSRPKGDVLLEGGPFSYSHKEGVKPFLFLSPGLHWNNGLGAGFGMGYTNIASLDATAIPIFFRFTYLPLDEVVSPAFQFHVGISPFSKDLNGINYSGSLYMHVSGGVGFNIKKNRGLLLQAGYGRINAKKKQAGTGGGSDLGTANFDGWMAIFGFKF